MNRDKLYLEGILTAIKKIEQIGVYRKDLTKILNRR